MNGQWITLAGLLFLTVSVLECLLPDSASGKHARFLLSLLAALALLLPLASLLGGSAGAGGSWFEPGEGFSPDAYMQLLESWVTGS